MKLIWTRRASEDLWSLHDYISRENEIAADAVAGRIVEAATRLAEFPEMGKIGRAENTRELVVPNTPYILAYRIRENSLRILRVMHGARRWPAVF